MMVSTHNQNPHEMEWLDIRNPIYWLAGRQIYEQVLTQDDNYPVTFEADKYFLSWVFLVAHGRHQWRPTTQYARAKLYHHWRDMARQNDKFEDLFVPDHYYQFEERRMESHVTHNQNRFVWLHHI